MVWLLGPGAVWTQSVGLAPVDQDSSDCLGLWLLLVGRPVQKKVVKVYVCFNKQVTRIRHFPKADLHFTKDGFFYVDEYRTI
jgi:hypothetical protein